MKSSKFICLASFAQAIILAACGGGTQQMGVFANISKIEGDVSFALTAPTSKSPAAFTFISSNPVVATISGSMVTILLAGTTTITASQASDGSWTAGSTTAVLTVTAATCVAPATRLNGICIATVSGNTVTRSSKIWLPVTLIDTWANANTFCSTTTINGLTGWRLPSEFELNDLYTSGQMNGQGWTLAKTWSSTEWVGSSNHYTVDLSNDDTIEQTNGTGAYVACVR